MPARRPPSKKRPAARKKVTAGKRGATGRKAATAKRKPAKRRAPKKTGGKAGASAARRPAAAGRTRAPQRRTRGPQPAGAAAPAAGGDLVTAGLSKEQFLIQNKTALAAITDTVNARLRAAYGTDTVAITRHDMCVVFYCEAGLKNNGTVDPNHTHSEGERGLLPLPDRIRDWNGSDAPAWNQPMTAETNVLHFFLYMGHLKNKDLTGAPRHLYRGLFRLSGIADGGEISAKVLAGVVHGYFYSGTYSDKTVPYDYLVQNYRDDHGLADFMRPTKYVHAGKQLMVNRERNIDTGLSLV
jgi:hypothetical protein